MTQSSPRRWSFPSLCAQLYFWFVFAAALTLDLWSKKAVFNWLERTSRNSAPIIDGFLYLTRAENPGAAFGIAADQRWLLVAVSVIAVVVTIAIFLFSRAEHRIVHISLGLFLAGVCGNLYDRLFNNGLVRDFIDVIYWPQKRWPTFNVADTVLCIAVGLLIISSLSTRKPAQEPPPPQK